METKSCKPEIIEIHKKEPIQFYRMKSLVAKLSISASSIWELVKNNQFPKPVKLTKNTTVFISYEVDAWAYSRIAERNNTVEK
jgi:prophage regulatory protein